MSYLTCLERKSVVFQFVEVVSGLIGSPFAQSHCQQRNIRAAARNWVSTLCLKPPAPGTALHMCNANDDMSYLTGLDRKGVVFHFVEVVSGVTGAPFAQSHCQQRNIRDTARNRVSTLFLNRSATGPTRRK
jgi:hypothetical protein